MDERFAGMCEQKARRALPRIVLPGLAVAGAAFAMAQAERSVATLPASDLSDISAIEYVARTTTALHRALDKSCTATGCDAGTLHPVITAAAAAMDAAELTGAIAAQDRILSESAAIRDAAEPGSAAHRTATAEWEAAGRIADLYRAELRLR